ncbi:fibroblast growth factor-binding protein 1-like [Genypterus blacodes]|uniref:fibroblast growth factor-binding protein 1-like n=1 Tax=Genypterus blacodes TaxID=154954 RepID=UPI003F75D5FC
MTIVLSALGNLRFEDMLLLRTFAPCLLLSILAQQVCLTSGKRLAGRTPTGRGKSSYRGMQCTWRAGDVGETVRLLVKCVNPEARITGGVTDRRCEYIGKPQSCPAFRSHPRDFWKQVSRAIKRLEGKLCTDDRVLVRTAVCKRAPRDSHFKLDMETSVVAAQSGEPNATRSQPRIRNTTVPSPAGNWRTPVNASTAAGEEECVDHRKTAEEYCRSSWTSVCTFFLSMLQSGDC